MDLRQSSSLDEFERQQRERERARRPFTIALWVASGVLGISLGLGVNIAIDRYDAAHARFMQQCMEDHKEYECTALWRASGRFGSGIIPLIIPAPTK